MLPPLERSVFCSEGIFSTVLCPASEISLPKRSLILGWDRSLAWLIGPYSQPRSFCTDKEILSCVASSGTWAARPIGVSTDAAECPSVLEIFHGQEGAYNRRHLFPPVNPPSVVQLHESFCLLASPAAWQRGRVDVGGDCPEGWQIDLIKTFSQMPAINKKLFLLQSGLQF